MLQIDLCREVPLVALGVNIFSYSGIAQQCVECAVASIKRQPTMGPVEVQLLLARD